MNMKYFVSLLLVSLFCGVASVRGQAQAAVKTETLLVEGSYLEYSITNRVSVITGTPVIVTDATSGLKLKCETLRVNWSTNNSGIDMAYADGNVVITLTDKDGQHTATGKHAVYDGKTDVITLTGNPVLETLSEVENRKLKLWDAEKVVYDRAVGKFFALDGKIKAEFTFPKGSSGVPKAASEGKK